MDKNQINELDENNSPILFTLYYPNLVRPGPSTGTSSEAASTLFPETSSTQSFPCLSPIPSSASYTVSSSSESSDSSSSESSSSNSSSESSFSDSSVVTDSKKQQQDTSRSTDEEEGTKYSNEDADNEHQQDQEEEEEDGPENDEDVYFEDFTRTVFIRVVTRYLEVLIKLKSFKVPSSNNPASIFFSIKKPGMGLYDYVYRLITYTRCSPSVFVVALIYLKRIATYHLSLRPCIMNIHRLLTVSILVAVKLLDDRSFSINHYAKVGGVPSKREMVRLEIAFLKLIHYDTFIHVYCYRLMFRNLLDVRSQLQSGRLTVTTTITGTESRTADASSACDNAKDTEGHGLNGCVEEVPIQGNATTKQHVRNSSEYRSSSAVAAVSTGSDAPDVNSATILSDGGKRKRKCSSEQFDARDLTMRRSAGAGATVQSKGSCDSLALGSVSIESTGMSHTTNEPSPSLLTYAHVTRRASNGEVERRIREPDTTPQKRGTVRGGVAPGDTNKKHRRD